MGAKQTSVKLYPKSSNKGSLCKWKDKQYYMEIHPESVSNFSRTVV